MRHAEGNSKVNKTWLGASEPRSNLIEAGVTVMGLDTVELGSLKNLGGRRLPSISLFIYCEQNACPHRVMRTNLLKEPLREHNILCLPRTLKLRYHGIWRWQLCELTTLSWQSKRSSWDLVIIAKARHILGKPCGGRHCQLLWNRVISIIGGSRIYTAVYKGFRWFLTAHQMITEYHFVLT